MATDRCSATKDSVTMPVLCPLRVRAGSWDSWCTDMNLFFWVQRMVPHLWRQGAERSGGAGVEFALVLPFLLVPIVNVPDVAIYSYQSMEVNAAAQAAADAALVTCGQTGMVPATTSCTGLTAAETAAAQRTSLGTGVT